MIPAQTRYETHDIELLAIVEVFKTWRHYLEGCKHKVLILTDHINLCQFMDTKSLSSGKSAWLRNFLVTTSESITVKASKRSYRCLVTILSEECWGRGHPLYQKRQDPALRAVLVGRSIWSFSEVKSNLPSPSGCHIRNNCLSPVVPVLGLPPKRYSSR